MISSATSNDFWLSPWVKYTLDNKAFAAHKLIYPGVEDSDSALEFIASFKSLITCV